jgi:ABC-2 type transport system permease protein
MPPWLKVFAHANPLTYQIDALRALMPAGGSSTFGLGVDFLVVLAVIALLLAVASRLYPRVAM